MDSRYEVELTVGSARDLKNVNWRHGELKPYAVAWVDSGAKCSTRVDTDKGENPVWDEKLVVPLPPSTPPHKAFLYIDVVHADAKDGVKPLVGSARLSLREVIDEVDIGRKASRTLRLKRPSGRPHGRLDVQVSVNEQSSYYNPAGSYHPAPAGYGSSARDPYGTAGGYAQPYAAPPPPVGYPVNYAASAPPAYGAAAAPAPAPYGAAAAVAAPAYGQPAAQKGDGKNKMGVGTGLAVGAAAGMLGGLAIAGGASMLGHHGHDSDSDDDDY